MADSGMLCPKCKCATTVYNSRQKPDGTTKRSRRCLACGFCFYTVEISEEKLKEKGIDVRWNKTQ